MIRVSKMADYGVVAISYMARDPKLHYSAAQVSRNTGVPLPSASKVLKLLAKANILYSRRGATGGYRLSKDPHHISVADLVIAIDGPIAITDCLEQTSGNTCSLEEICFVRKPWQKVSKAIQVALEEVTLADIAGSYPKSTTTKETVGGSPEVFAHLRNLNN